MVTPRVSLSAADLWLGRQTRTSNGAFAKELAKAEAELDEVQLKEAAVEIEAIFFQQLLVQMRRTVPKRSLPGFLATFTMWKWPG